MINTNLSTLMRSKVGATYRAPGMGGYVTVAYRHSGNTVAKGVASLADGDTIIAFQPRATGTSWLFVISGDQSDETVSGPFMVSGGLQVMMGKTLTGNNNFTLTRPSSDLVLSGELLGFILSDRAWLSLEFPEGERSRAGTGVW